MVTDPRYPIGKFVSRELISPEELHDYISRITSLPARLESSIQGWSPVQMDTPYRDGGWTVRQVIHHIADSHMNAYIRVKWALTEASPTIKPYDEKAWAGTPENAGDAGLSLALIKALHAKWVVLLKGLSVADLARDFVHPATKRSARLDQLAGMYAWHGDHHLAHITELKKLKNW